MIISDHEFDLLSGLPLAAQLMYLRVLRRRMDYSTGIVGDTHAISWQGICLELTTSAQPGIAQTRPSRDQARRLAGHLERCGLVECLSDQAARRLVFRLPHAVLDTCAFKKAANKSNHLNRTTQEPVDLPRETNNDAAFDGFDTAEILESRTMVSTRKPPNIRIDKTRDEIDAREAVLVDWPPTDVSVEPGLSSAEAVAVLRGLLVGQRIIPDGRFMRAAQPLVAICRQRRVSKTEVTMAFSDAVMRGAGDPVAYAVRILERGSLVAPPAYGSAGGRKGSAPAGGQGGSAVLDYLAGVA